ncbi:MBL fold metallo-hydrolase [Marinitoga aeolica]|uniref:MBL fold metallo-hydrolase n=1 Tax=Marinitoga aeolica TaxID=2809031 RepID=A0ABY8PSC3_9BACT|nr:MBL fold metallo-hydrolase [Marinitoga aeolica]WGS65541.1 MBL fold metallo-hydrolase [Marinitoga aeolica]
MDIFPFYGDKGIKVYLFILPPFGVNTYVITTNKTIIIIDPGKFNGLIFNFFDIGSFKYKGVLVTHTHYDHIIGLKDFENFEIMIPEKEKMGLTDSSVNLSFLFSDELKLNIHYKELYEGYYNYGDLKFLASYYPGHTPGSMIYDFGDFIFTGDFIFSESIGRTDLPYGDEKIMFQSLAKFNEYIKAKEETTLIMPGHMGICTLKELKKNNIFLKYGGKK